MWMPERVWEQSLTSDLAAAGIEYTMLDDFHFKNAGLDEDAAARLLPHRGRRPSCSPSSPAASGCGTSIPFAEPQETIDYLRGIAEQQPDAVVVFGDDGEKFGTWPGTKEHVYDDGWLRRFFDALRRQPRAGSSVVTPAEALDSVPPLGKIYLPEGSYREMTEWALPGRAARRVRARRTTSWSTTALAADRAVRPRRLLAELQGEVSRNQRDVRADA